MNTSYAEFLAQKRHEGAMHGFDPSRIPDALFDFQRSLVEWSVRKGRAAIFADCGLGKTAMQLAWADNVARHTGKPCLILTPLAVGAQTVAEAGKFGIEATRSRDGSIGSRIVVTNYEMLNRFAPGDFGGVVCDESSILKSFDGAIRGEVTVFMRKVPYRLLATATAAPNDYTELGTSSEALGEMGHMDMLNRFFINDKNNSSTSRRHYGEAPSWRFKGHSQTPFWRWVASWARACRKPSDLGFDDGRMILPPLVENAHMVEARKKAPGMLFSLPAATLFEQREEKKRTVEERCAMVADIVNPTGQPAIVWCQMNDEAAALKRSIPDAVEVSGSDSDDAKEDKFTAFIDGRARVLVTKPKIGAWGLNFQHCAHVCYFPSHSYEQYYQAVRRCWRFGQTRPVVVDVVMTEGERRIMDNMQRKADQARVMFDSLVSEMGNAQRIAPTARASGIQEVPSWL